MSIQYITDAAGIPQAVVVPIADWAALLEHLQSLEPSRNDTDYLLSSSSMKERLLKAKERMSNTGKTWEEVRDALDL